MWNGVLVYTRTFPFEILVNLGDEDKVDNGKTTNKTILMVDVYIRCKEYSLMIFKGRGITNFVATNYK